MASVTRYTELEYDRVTSHDTRPSRNYANNGAFGRAPLIVTKDGGRRAFSVHCSPRPTFQGMIASTCPFKPVSQLRVRVLIIPIPRRIRQFASTTTQRASCNQRIQSELRRSTPVARRRTGPRAVFLLPRQMRSQLYFPPRSQNLPIPRSPNRIHNSYSQLSGTPSPSWTM